MATFIYSTEDEVIHAALHIMESKLIETEFFGALDNATQYFQLRLGSSEREIFSVMFLNSQLQMIVTEDLFFGGLEGAQVFSREVVKAALRCNAAACLFAHNHPSGNPQPSEADRLITQRLIDALELVDVRVVDHIIVTKSQTFSFAQRGLL